MNNDGAPAHLAEFANDLSIASSRSRIGAEPYDAMREEDSIRQADPEDMVKQVTRRIEQLQERLGANRGCDKSGKLVYALPEGPVRSGMEKELHHLRTCTLPNTQQRAAVIAAKKAALPTVAQQLQEQVDRRARIHAAAQKRAEEIEVDDLARRILANRRRSSGGVG